VWGVLKLDMVFGLGCKYLMLIGEVSPAISGCLGRAGGCCCEPGSLMVRNKKRGELFAPLPALEGN